MAKIVINKKWLLVLAGLVCLSGCGNNSDIEITKDDALEVALDEAGYKQDQVQSVSVKEKEDCFDVYFDVETGRYHVVISEKGLVDSFEFEKGVFSKKTENNLVEKEPVKEETKEQEKEVKSSFDKEPMVEGGLSEEAIAQKVSQHLGFNEYKREDFNFKLNKERTECTVTIHIENSGNSIVVIDVKSGVIYSTLINQ